VTWIGLVTVAGLGAFHGLNPGMGWLFAVAIGLQERSARSLLRALAPIAAGHAGSVFAFVTLMVALRSVLATRVVAIAGGLVLVGFGLYQALSRRHLRRAGMRLTPWQLTSWSFLMSSVHGAGLMLLPVLVARVAFEPVVGPVAGEVAAHDHGAAMAGSIAGSPASSVLLWQGTAAVLTHTAAMAVVAGAVALLVYRVWGLGILRVAWIDLDKVWAVALIGSGVATVALAV